MNASSPNFAHNTLKIKTQLGMKMLLIKKIEKVSVEGGYVGNTDLRQSFTSQHSHLRTQSKMYQCTRLNPSLHPFYRLEQTPPDKPCHHRITIWDFVSSRPQSKATRMLTDVFVMAAWPTHFYSLPMSIAL